MGSFGEFRGAGWGRARPNVGSSGNILQLLENTCRVEAGVFIPGDGRATATALSLENLLLRGARLGCGDAGSGTGAPDGERWDGGTARWRFC